MRTSLILPIPGPASPAEVLEFAEAADELGYHAVYMNSRVARPLEAGSRHPYMADGKWPWPPEVNWPDAFVVFSAIATRTTRLRFGPMVVPIIVTHPLTLAKQAASLDQYSNGRAELGVGAGWMLEEAAAIDRPTDRRWTRLQETIEIIRLAWTQDTVSFSGRCYRFPPVGVHPHPVQPGLPIWVGGHGPRALEIAARAGAGLFLWGGYALELVADYVRRVRSLSETVPIATLVSSTTPPQEMEPLLKAMEKEGVDMVVLSRIAAEGDARLRVIKGHAARFF